MIIKLVLALFTVYSSQLLAAFDESQLASSLGLELISEGHPYNFMGINSVYANDSMTRQMLVASNVEGDLKEIRFLKQNDFLILEVPKGLYHYYSIALVGISEAEIKKHLKLTSFWNKLFQKINPFPAAYADECRIYGSADVADLEKLQEYFGSSITKDAAKCISTVLKVETADEIQRLAEDSAAFWRKKIQEFNNLKSFIQYFDVKTKELGINLAGLPSETKIKLICSFVRNLTPEAARGVLKVTANNPIILKLDDYLRNANSSNEKGH